MDGARAAPPEDVTRQRACRNPSRLSRGGAAVARGAGPRHQAVLAFARSPPDAVARGDRAFPRRRRQPRLQLRRGDGGRRRARRDRSIDDGIAQMPGTLPGRRDARRGRPSGRIQLSVGLVERVCSRESLRA